ncbi:mismatch-specific DNA-glycosylase [Mycobacterium paraffinicum]|uniref:Mismatch-specific DNA-glycosylase n=1 Tax=Mycobacterium paraffinicum TaxID=53378 RepID=A0A1Q4HSG5_9MYCO|nr:mismatch-specific DNA-glycosylase [Mycobacterium paraffinicum]
MAGYSSDVLSSGLNVVFCGINPAATAARSGHSFSHPSNRFWSVLYLAGFTDHRLRPEDERQLLTYGCGITAVVSRPTTRASNITTSEIRSAAPLFEAKVRHYAPNTVAFLGKRAIRALRPGDNLRWGTQDFRFAGTRIWLLPNPSGLNRSFSLDGLVAAYAELRRHVQRQT